MGLINALTGQANDVLSAPNAIGIGNQVNQQNVQQQQVQAQTANAQQDLMQKRRQMALSMLNGVQDPDTYSKIAPLAERYDPTLKLPDTYDPVTINAIRMGNVPTAALPEYQMMTQQAGMLQALRDRLAGTQSQMPPVNGQQMQQGHTSTNSQMQGGMGNNIDPGTLNLMAAVNPNMANAMVNAQKLQYDSPEGQEQIERARKQGANQAENIQGANVATATLGNLEQNLDALSKLNKDLPSSDWAPVDLQAEISKRNPFSDKVASNAYEQFQEVNQQQILNGLSELVKSGAIRGNQFVEKILARGYAINPDAPPATRQAEIENLRAELQNITARQQNVAGGNQPYKPIPVKTAQDQSQSLLNGGQGDAYQAARNAIKKGASPAAVAQRLRENGLDPSKL